MNLVKPKRLKKGDLIGVISPSAGAAGFFPHRVEQASKELERLGFKLKIAGNALKTESYVSASAEHRAEDLHELFADPAIKAIIAATGGNHSNQMLKFLDFKLIKANPKIFCGYSDNTVLHYTLASQANLTTFYGPCLVTQFGEYPHILPYTEDHFIKALSQVEPIGPVLPSENYTCEFLDWGQKKDLDRPRHLIPGHGYQWWQTGRAKAPVFGGAVPSINHLAGTRYWVDPTDKILFLDHPEGEIFGTGFPLSWLDSFLADLDNMGVFRQIKGLVIGRAYNLSPEQILQLKQMVLNYTSGFDYPVLYDFNIGHTDPIITLPLGVMVRMDSFNNTFEILESGVS